MSPPPRPAPRLHRLAVAAACLLLGPAPAALAKNGAYRDAPHGNPLTGVARVPGLARGECAHCHGAPREPGGRKAEGAGHTRLFSINDNALCLGCHRRADGAWLGERAWQQATHGTSPAAVWPGPEPRGRDPADAGKCVNCHDPHGVRDAAGVVPALLRARGAALCLGCHGGAAGPDVATDLAKTWRHPLVAPVAPAAATPSAALAGSTAAPRAAPAAASQPGATCSGCHNVHAAAEDQGRAATGASPRALLGVARVRVSNGVRGAAPLRTATDRADLTAVREYELCFGCHAGGSAASVASARGLDVAAALNPANASFHPVEAPGRGGALDRRAFVNGWGSGRLVTCSDCHGSDDGLVRGPHGSRHAHLLRRRAPTRGPGQQAQETDLCFECHAWRTYGDPFSGAERAYSRFTGHVTHVARGESCWACHEAHGSAQLPALLALARRGWWPTRRTGPGAPAPRAATRPRRPAPPTAPPRRGERTGCRGGARARGGAGWPAGRAGGRRATSRCPSR